MTSPGSAGRQRTQRQYSAEDQALNQISVEAESRLAARRAARAEARDIRMKELEKQQKEMEQKHDRIYEITSNSSTPTGRLGSRRGSDDSTSSEDTRELRKQIAELEEKYKKAMMNNAQLDNEKQTYRYQVDLLKDQMEDMEEELIETQRLHKDRCRDLEQKKRDYKDLQQENEFHKVQVEQRDKLIADFNLVFISNELEEREKEKENNTADKKGRRKKKRDAKELEGTTALVTKDALEILGQQQGNLDQRLKQLADDKLALEDEVRKLQQQLEEEREKNAIAAKYAADNDASKDGDVKQNGPSSASLASSDAMHVMEAQRDIFSELEVQKQLNDYKFRLSKAEQENTMLEGNVVRLESQAKRYKGLAETYEKSEDELKAEKRKLQRELREAQIQIQEVQSTNEHLKMRMEKIRQAGRNALTKP